jgi:hypothetical protein
MAVQAVRDLDILRRGLTGRKRWANARQCQAILVIANERRYLRILKSLGAAHWVAQCWRWKTGAERVRTRIQTRVLERGPDGVLLSYILPHSPPCIP